MTYPRLHHKAWKPSPLSRTPAGAQSHGPRGSDDGHDDAVAGEVVRVRGAFRQSIGFRQPHEAGGLALQQLARPDAGAIDQDQALSG